MNLENKRNSIYSRLLEIYRSFRKYIKKIYYRALSDEKHLSIIFKNIFGRKMDIVNPLTFNEKLQWLKLYWRDPRSVICSDKLAVREYLVSLGLGHLLINIIATFNNVDDIDIDKLPNKFVLKCTHGSGCNIICKDKANLNWKESKKKLNNWMNTNYFWFSREWPYKNIIPRIVCEEYMEDSSVGELLDYKFFCFNGKPEMIFFCSDRSDHVKSDFYNLNWELLPFRWEYEPSGKLFPKPSTLDEMIEYAKILSKDFPVVRVDFYEVNGKVYFGELTFFHGGGFGRFYPSDIDIELGNKIKLP